MFVRINNVLFLCTIFFGIAQGASSSTKLVPVYTEQPYSCVMVHTRCIWEPLIKDTIARYPDIAFIIAHNKYFPKIHPTGNSLSDRMTQKIFHHANEHHNDLLCAESIKASGIPMHIIIRDNSYTNTSKTKSQ